MKYKYLKGNIICALPQLNDIFFSKSIIYLTHHNKDGAVGIVLNYKIMTIKAAELFKKLNIGNVSKNLETEFLFHVGGPLNQNNGFILHSKDYESKNTMKVSKQVRLTCSTEIIRILRKTKDLKNFLSHLVILDGGQVS